jgi:radical SAM superfamily enzyme YgiQ (UPF0313 family)
MKITLIKPNIGRLEHSLYVDEGRMEPLQLGVLAGLTPADVEVALYDDRVETVPFDEPTDLAAVTVETFTARRAYEIAAEFRSRGVPVVLGGMHVTLLPEEAARHADAICIGDAETVWQTILEDARRGKLRPRYHGTFGRPQLAAPTRRDLFRGKGYLPITLLQFSRGCRFSCRFCATSSYFEQRQFFRRVDEVVREIAGQERKFLFFVDDNIVSDPQAAKILFRELIPLKVRWVSQASLDMIHDPQLMRLMVDSGCLGHVVGLETLDIENLRSMGKEPNLDAFSGYRRELAVLRDYGLQLWAAFTLGYEFETPESIERTLAFALKNRFAFAAFNILMPYPNTPWYRELAAEGRLLYDGQWWLHPEYRFNHAAFLPRRMTPEALTEAGFLARAQFNSLGSIFRRIFDLKTNMRSLSRLGIFLAYSRIFRREVFKKQGMRLGVN